MMTRSNSRVSDSLDPTPGSARSAPSSPGVGRGTMKCARSLSSLAVARNSNDPARALPLGCGPCRMVNRFMRL